MRRLLLVGAGHSHLEVLRRFGQAAPPGAEVVLVSPGREAPYSGMLPGLVAGHYTHAEAHVAVEPLATRARAEFHPARVVALDPEARRATLDDGSAIAFDLASLDVGSSPAVAGVVGAAEHALAVRPVDRFLAGWDGVCDAARRQRGARLAVVGGGPAGVELALAMHHRLVRELGDGSRVSVSLVGDAPRLLPQHAACAARLAERSLRERGVALHLGQRVARCDEEGLLLQGGERVAADTVVWAAGSGAPRWLAATGLACDAAGYVAVDDTLRSVSHPAVFAAGDCASMVAHPRPRSGVIAVRQGPPLASNLAAVLAGGTPTPFVPQREALAIVATGDRRGIATRGGWALEGAWVWRWKDHLDRAFMARYRVSDA